MHLKIILGLVVIMLTASRGWWFWSEDEEAHTEVKEEHTEGVEEHTEVHISEAESDVLFDNLEMKFSKESLLEEWDPDFTAMKDREERNAEERGAKGPVKESKPVESMIITEEAKPVENMIITEESKPVENMILPEETKPEHFHLNGEHNQQYDHQVFLGEAEAETFKSLSPEESRARLAGILEKVDLDQDKLVSVQELTAWIKQTGARSAKRRTDVFWLRSNPENRPELSWDEYRARQFGFLTDARESTMDGRWVGEDDVDSQTLNVYRKLEERDRRRWTVADRNKNLQLDKEEFLGFLHPDLTPHMADILVIETMADLDKDGDGKLNLSEYVHNVFGETKSTQDWETGGLQFRQFRDHNKDGFIDKKELKSWLLPEDYDQDKAEAEHLVLQSDTDGDKLLSLPEAMDRYSIFVASQATNFGEDLHISHDEL